MAGFFEKLAGVFGWSSEERDRRAQLRRLRAEEARLEDFRRNRTDHLGGLKGEIRTLEAKALAKNRELSETKGEGKRIVCREIEQVFTDRDRLKGREGIILADLERSGKILARVRELIAMIESEAFVSSDQLDDVIQDSHEVYGKRRDTDRVEAEMDRVTYAPPEVRRAETEEPITELQSETEPVKPALEQPSPIALSPETERRMKELEAEES